nr:methionine synthase [Candidatus Prometheoarchaeum syntrophicum]
MNDKKYLGACLEDCVHTAGILNFFQVISDLGFESKFLGPANKIPEIITQIKKSNAKNIAISYRLTPETGKKHIENFINIVKQENLTDRNYYLGGLPELIKYAKTKNFFKEFFVGGETFDIIISQLHGSEKEDNNIANYPSDLISRIRSISPYPIIRAHFGLSSLEETYNGVKEIAEAKVLDIISIAPDQACQEFLHHPEIINKIPKGAGGVPIRNKQDLVDLYENSQIGNFPLLRIYSGTQDLIKNAELFHDTILNAWAAIPIFWYSQLDGRGPKSLFDSISEHFKTIKWHAARKIPVEVNDPHQWGLRMAPDHIVVADAYISAYIAKKLGVKIYIEQFMFNTPAGNTLNMDLARVLAMKEIVEPLIDQNFEVLRETRAGLSYFSSNDKIAKGQLCTSTLIQMSIKPHIVHVVSHSEATHAALPEDIIESCTILKRLIQDSVVGLPDYAKDPLIDNRKNEILGEAQVLLDYIIKFGLSLGYKDPLLSPEFLTLLVQKGILDAPQLISNKWALGKIKTRIINGKCLAVDNSDSPISEKKRLGQIKDALYTGLIGETQSSSIKEV